MPINLAGSYAAGGLHDALLEIVKQRMLEQELAQRQEENQFQRLRADRLDQQHADETTYQHGRDTAGDLIAAQNRTRQEGIDARAQGKDELAAMQGMRFKDLVDPATQGLNEKATPAIGLPPLPGTSVMGVSPPAVRQGKIRTVKIGNVEARPDTYEELESTKDAASQRQINEAQARQGAHVPSLQHVPGGSFNPETGQYQKAEGWTPPETGGGVSSGGDVDPEAIADAIIAGQQPPTTQGLYRYGAAVKTALAKKGYDLTKAATDWAATQRFFSSANGPQQLRMRQAVDNTDHSLDIISDLADQWKGGNFPILNRAQLSAAMNGAMGVEAQKLATQLQTQISDVTSELGNVYMGGNSPTDHALQLAAKNLSADWSLPQLQAAIKLAKTNIQIRKNSIANTQPMTTGSSGFDTGGGGGRGGGAKSDPLGIRKGGG